MKKKIFTLPLLVLFTFSYAQKSLREALAGEDGLSKHFTILKENLQVAFTAEKAGSILGLDANANLILQGTETDQLGTTHYRYLQTYKNILVENSMYIAHTQRSRLISMSGTIVTDFGRNAKISGASLSSKEAIDIAIKYVHAEKYAWQDADFEQRIKIRKGNQSTYYPVAEKVWYSGDDRINPSNLKLAYKVDIYSLTPFDRKYIYVDAQSGEILGTRQILKSSDVTGNVSTGYSGTRAVHVDYTGSSYRLRDYTKGDGIITLHASAGHADYTSASANFKYTNSDKWALDAHYGAASAYRFYKNNFNRNSIDNNGFAIVSWVNNASITDNAYWDGAEMNYGNLSSNGNGVVGIDIVGHELTHGFTEQTSNLVYSREPGAINESMSDIMGKSVQFYAKPTDSSWILSNDMGWEIRSFSDPNANQQPDTYKGTYWISSSYDNYGVHINSGVGNFMFYLLVKGGSGTNDIGSKYSVKGIGLSKADQIIYRTNTTYLTSTSQYADWRMACIQAAADLYGTASNEVKQVKNAWYAVGIGASGDNPSDITYCISKGLVTDYEYINKVVFGTISNTSGNNNGYKDFTGLSTKAATGNTYNITLTPAFSGSSYTEYWTVYVDYNQDGILDGSGEIAATGSGSSTKTLSFTVPSTAKTGNTRLRIQMVYGTALTDPCTTFSYGEVEDYTVNITAPSALAEAASIVSLKPESNNSMTIRPNPAKGANAMMKYELAVDGKTTLKMLTVNGSSIKSADLGYQKKGIHTYNLSNLNALSTGNYFVILEQNNKIIGRKLIMISK